MANKVAIIKQGTNQQISPSHRDAYEANGLVDGAIVEIIAEKGDESKIRATNSPHGAMWMHNRYLEQGW